MHACRGVIYGDIATSPLYAFGAVFYHTPDTQEVYGAASLILWILTIAVMVKYVGIVLWVDDNGQGQSVVHTHAGGSRAGRAAGGGRLPMIVK